MRDIDPRRLPVIVGVGQLRNNRARRIDEAREPLELIAAAANRAVDDAGRAGGLIDAIDGVDVVRSLSWMYDDLPRLIASAIGATPTRADHSDVGGNQPVELVDRAAARVFAGEERAVLVCGGETRASLAAFQRAGMEPPWSQMPGGAAKPTPERWASERALRYGLNVPLRGYPLYENALRARLGQTHRQAQRWSAELLAEFSAIAVKNDAAWDPVARTVEEVENVGTANRMLCFPYTLLMVAQPVTDQAAAVIVTSVAQARDWGVPETQLVYVWGGAGSADSKDLLARADYATSPAMACALEQTLAQAGIEGADLDIVDLYSCYPVVPKLAIEILGLREGVRRTATGGLNAFGAPANNYSLHAVVSITSALREGGSVGLVYGNGETVTKHHAILLARDVHVDGYVGAHQLSASPAADPPPIVDLADGPATVETYTVEHSRDGVPVTGYVIGRTADGGRFAAHSYEPSTLARLVSTHVEPIGAKGAVHTADDGLNRFELA